MSTDRPGFAGLTVDGWLERVAAREPAPGGGAVAATTVAGAAALVAMAARFSDGEVARLAESADALRARAIELADADARAYTAVLEAYRISRDAPGRREAITSALERAADVPLAIAETAREAGERGAVLVREGNPNLRGDAVTAVLLAQAAGRSAAHLVRLNVELGDLDGDRIDRSLACCEALAQAARAAEA